MSKLLSVAQLKAGDRFEFVAIGDKFAGSSAKDSAHMMIVANEPKVNRAANSCFFRYKAEADPIESRSFNGTAEIEVRCFTEHSPLAAALPPAAPPQAAVHASNGHAPTAHAAAQPKAIVEPVAAIVAVAPVAQKAAEPETEVAEIAADDTDESTEEDATPAKPARKKAAVKTAVAKKSPKAAATKTADVKAPAAKKKPTKAATLKTTATKKAAKPAAKKKA